MKFKCDTCGKVIEDSGMVCGCEVIAMSCDCGNGAMIREDTPPRESVMARRPEVYLSPEDISWFIGLPLNRIYRLLRSGQLKGSRIGKHWRIAESDFKAFMKSCLYVPSQESEIREIPG